MQQSIELGDVRSARRRDKSNLFDGESPIDISRLRHAALGAWPMIATSAADADHFQAPRSMP